AAHRSRFPADEPRSTAGTTAPPASVGVLVIRPSGTVLGAGRIGRGALVMSDRSWTESIGSRPDDARQGAAVEAKNTPATGDRPSVRAGGQGLPAATRSGRSLSAARGRAIRALFGDTGDVIPPARFQPIAAAIPGQSAARACVSPYWDMTR